MTIYISGSDEPAALIVLPSVRLREAKVVKPKEEGVRVLGVLEGLGEGEGLGVGEGEGVGVGVGMTPGKVITLP